MQKTLGGDRLGSGKRMKVPLKNFERSTHDLGYIWRSTMSAGTLVPFMSEIALPGDTFDIKLSLDGKTLPSVGPLFGSFKMQLDVFQCPIRLYNSYLHNNMLNIGLKMNTILLPFVAITPNTAVAVTDPNYEYSQINPSALISYLGLKGIGTVQAGGGTPTARQFNAVPLLAYWEIYKQYYSNKQEARGWQIGATAIIETVTSVEVDGTTLDENPASNELPLNTNSVITINYTGALPQLNQIIFRLDSIGDISAQDIAVGWTDTGTALVSVGGITVAKTQVANWRYATVNEAISLSSFPLENIDTMRINLLGNPGNEPFRVDTAGTPYSTGLSGGNNPEGAFSQVGLGLKTYQSDLFNNWLNTEYIDGSGGINEITAVDTSTGNFQIPALIMARKVYDMLNQIAVSGATYDDWLDAVYNEDRYLKAEMPMYMGGLSQELVFQQVVSLAESAPQPLGTLAGRGTMHQNKKGGQVHIKVDEPSYIIGIVSLTPRLDYSQGNKWDLGLATVDDLHKPALDQIGFQELITEQMAWFDTYWNGTAWVQNSAGKQPAWINYMTNINRTYGNFAIRNNQMFMTLNRRYDVDPTTGGINDLTTYIDPTKYNYIFAQTSLDAQNFWIQIAVDNTVRRKMSAKIMPNL
nr:MAG: major capsid protein [Microviridae sp.]